MALRVQVLETFRDIPRRQKGTLAPLLLLLQSSNQMPGRAPEVDDFDAAAKQIGTARVRHSCATSQGDHKRGAIDLGQQSGQLGDFTVPESPFTMAPEDFRDSRAFPNRDRLVKVRHAQLQ